MLQVSLVKQEVVAQCGRDDVKQKSANIHNQKQADDLSDHFISRPVSWIDRVQEVVISELEHNIHILPISSLSIGNKILMNQQQQAATSAK